MKKDIFYIGGSTCCGKSTVTEMLCQGGQFRYYKLDDDLFHFLDVLVERGHALATFQKNATTDEMWLRDPKVQSAEELLFYRDILPLAFDKMLALPSNLPILTEGAGYLPAVMKEKGVPTNRYVCIVPTREFRLQEYQKRPWIGAILEGASDKAAAFANWMERDALFAESVLADAKRLGYATYVVDGNKPVAATLEFVKKVFQI